MRQFRKIVRFELKNYMTNKVFVGITLFAVIAIAVVMFFPRLTEAIGSDTPDPEAPRPVLLISADESIHAPIAASFAAAFPDHDVRLAGTDRAEIETQIVTGAAECAFCFDSLTSYTYFVNNLSMYDTSTAIADEVLRTLYRTQEMTAHGMSAAAVQGVLSAQVTHETVTLGKDQMQNFFYTYIMIFALYMVILLYGQMVASNVATEKSSRAMELLVTSADPVSMMFGKVIASCTAGLVQLVVIFGSSLLCFHANRAYWGEDGMMASFFNIPVDLVGYMLLFFVLGFFIYAFLYGAVGSTVSKLEDINTAVMPITMLFIAGFFVVVFSMASGSVDTALLKVCSFIPFTAPMAMFTRIAMSTVPVWEIALSILILAASVVGVGVLAAKIYRIGVLLYGTPPKPGAILKALRRA